MSATAAGELAGTTVLLVDDDTAHREALAACLVRAGAAVTQAADGRHGLSSFRETLPDLVVADLRMPRMDGLEMTAGVKAARPGTPVVLITAYGDSHALARAIELGVDGFVPKPIDVDVLLRTVGRCALPIRQRHEIEALTRCAAASLEGRLGPSAAMREVRETVRLVAASSFSVLLQGDTGVGKSHVARVVHELSPRSGGPFVHVDLGSIPETLVEGELLGVRRGAYTGADRDRPERLEAAGRGTLFLDELSSIPPSVQAKLLQAVEERRYTPLGARAPVAL